MLQEVRGDTGDCTFEMVSDDDGGVNCACEVYCAGEFVVWIGVGAVGLDSVGGAAGCANMVDMIVEVVDEGMGKVWRRNNG